jgi:hypothetical protein
MCKSTRAIAKQLGRHKHPVSHAKVAQPRLVDVVEIAVIPVLLGGGIPLGVRGNAVHSCA